MTRLLLAEDDEDLRFVAESLFRPPRWEVVLAPDGDAALAAFDAGGADVVVLDVDMPGPDGVEVAARLRARGWDGPILLWTGWSATVDPERAEDLGARVVPKVDLPGLQALLDEHVD